MQLKINDPWQANWSHLFIHEALHEGINWIFPDLPIAIYLETKKGQFDPIALRENLYIP